MLEFEVQLVAQILVEQSYTHVQFRDKLGITVCLSGVLYPANVIKEIDHASDKSREILLSVLVSGARISAFTVGTMFDLMDGPHLRVAKAKILKIVRVH